MRKLWVAQSKLVHGQWQAWPGKPHLRTKHSKAPASAIRSCCWSADLWHTATATPLCNTTQRPSPGAAGAAITRRDCASVAADQRPGAALAAGRQRVLANIAGLGV